MSDQDDGPLHPAIRTTTGDVAHFTSRLLQRGVSLLSEPVLLDLSVMDLDARDWSIYVRAHAVDGDDSMASYRDEDWWIKRREVVIFEYSRYGKFSRCIKLPLLKLIPRGLGVVERRTPGEVSFGDTSIHYYEEFETTQFSRPVRIDYLFSKSGRVLASWCNEHFAHDYRPAGYPPIPHPSAMIPDYLLGNLMVRVVSEMHYHPSTGEQVEESLKERIYFCTVAEFIEGVNSAEVYTSNRGNGVQKEGVEFRNRRSPEHSAIVDFPLPDHFVNYGRSFLRGWRSSIADHSKVWFLSHRSPGGKAVVWSLNVGGTKPEVEVFETPHPYDLVRKKLIPIYWDDKDEEDDNLWTPTDEDYRQLEQYEDSDESVITLMYWLEGVSGNKVLIGVERSGNNRSDEQFLVLFKIWDGQMIAVKQIDPSQIAFNQWARNPDVGKLWRSQPAYEISRHFTLNGTHLFSEGENYDGRRGIVVTDVEKDQIWWFYPEVVESHLDPDTAALLRFARHQG